MEPRVRGLDYGRVIDEEVPEEEGDSAERNRAQKRMLTEAFGTQRSRLRVRGLSGDAKGYLLGYLSALVDSPKDRRVVMQYNRMLLVLQIE